MMITSDGLGIYVHIPFCLKKCSYCDFLSFDGKSVSGGTDSFCGNDRRIQELYVAALVREIQYWGKRVDHRNEKDDCGYFVNTVFLGGGTPSILKPDLTAEIMKALQNGFTLNSDAEITMEANPGTLSMENLRAYREMGINRLSLGVQSLNDTVLRTLGRIHSSKEAIEGIRAARKAGFKNINVDLMFGIPGQKENDWNETLKRVLAEGPEHISFYSLQLEEGTPLFRKVKDGGLFPLDWEIDRRMYRNALDLLTAWGYLHYEISNAAKPGFESRHNLKYWSMEEYLGMGLGAHSYMKCNMGNPSFEDAPESLKSGFTRFHNTENMEAYVSYPPEYKPPDFYLNTRQDQISEYLFTGLRKLAGISLTDFQRRYGINLMDLYGKEIRKHQEAGLLYLDEQRDTLALTLEGIDISNRVLADFV